MKLSFNTGKPAVTFGLKKAVEMIADAGFDALDFSEFDAEFYTDAHDRAFYRDIRSCAEDRGLYFNQAHAPFPSSYPEEAKTKETFGHIVHGMEIASWLGVRDIIVHPCQHLEYADDGNPERLYEINMDFYRSLQPYCEEYGIRIAVENMWQYPRTVCHSTCSRPEEFVKYMDSLDNRWFVACLDIGHAMLVKEMPDGMIRALGGQRLRALHVHDVDGIHDSHTLPYYGIVNWEKVMKALAQVDYQGELTYEASNFLTGVPEALWPDALKYMERVGRHLISRFDAYREEIK